MTLAKQRLLVFLFPLLLAAPFLNRAYFVDDHFFAEIARWITTNPFRPYDFPEAGRPLSAETSKEDIALRIVNPLLHHYYLAGLLKVGGDREWFLRLGCVVFSCFSGLFVFGLARRWLEHPLLATLLVLSTPVHWLTSYSLLIDATLAFFFLAALSCVIRATEEDSIRWALLGGICMGCALLTKYTAVLIFPVTAAWIGLHWQTLRRRWIFALAWGIGGAIFLSYVMATKVLYGSPHVLTSSGSTLHGIYWGKIMVLLVFLSGATIAPLLAWAAFRSRTVMSAALVLVILLAIFSSPTGGFPKTQATLLALWITTSALLLTGFAGCYRFWKPRQDLFIFIWLGVFLLMMTVVMQWVAGRYYMMALPPLVFMAVRLLELKRPEITRRLLAAGLGGTLLVGAAMAFADYRQAESARSVVEKLREQNLLEGERNYYDGGAFTMAYLQKLGWKACDDAMTLSPGDRVIVTDVSLPAIWFLRGRPPVKLITVIDIPARFPLKVMYSKASAGFYASAWGPLPFTWAEGPWERFYLFEIIPR